MKTFAEKRGEEPFDWWDALNNPEKYKDVILTDISGQWTTCACGNLCHVIPRETQGKPKDNILANLGFSFHWRVQQKKWEEAKSILHEIERRSSEIIAEIKEEKREKRKKK